MILTSRGTILAACSLIMLTFSCSKSPGSRREMKKEAAAKPAPSIPQVKVTPAIQAKAQMSKPVPTVASKKAADQFGKGKAAVTIKDHPGGVNHSFWSEELDVDGSGNAVQVDEAWDGRHKVLYLTKERPFACGHGQTVVGSTLMAVYGKGNTLGKPSGSGWWVAELDEGECSVPAAGIYGCRFGADGNNEDCGVATVEADRDDVEIAPLPGMPQAGTPGATSTPGSDPK